MSRRALVVRSQDQANAVARPRTAGTFTWNASLQNSYGTIVPSGGSSDILGLAPLHATFGLDDFNSDVDGTRIVIPRTGIYSVSARVGAYTPDPNADYPVAATIIGTGTPPASIGYDERGLTVNPDNPGGTASAMLNPGTAGFPFTEGAQVWVMGTSYAPSDVEMSVQMLSVTYEAELGLIYELPGGG